MLSLFWHIAVRLFLSHDTVSGNFLIRISRQHEQGIDRNPLLSVRSRSIADFKGWSRPTWACYGGNDGRTCTWYIVKQSWKGPWEPNP